MIRDISSSNHYFAYEPALKYSFELDLPSEMKSCGEIMRYEHCDIKEMQFCIRHYQMVTHLSPYPIRWGQDCAITEALTDSLTLALDKAIP